jgi:acyl-CoA synthetase (AMP-forming)/AMP-acid ligase II
MSAYRGGEGFSNVAEHLPRMARDRRDALAIVFPEKRVAGRRAYTTWTYGQLDEESSRIADGLSQIGIGRGTRTVLMVRPSLPFFALTFGLFKLGAVPVMVDPGMGVKNLRECLGRARPTAFVGVPEAHVARSLFRWARSTVTTKVMVGPRALALPFGRGMHTLDAVRARGSASRFRMETVEKEDVAAILFTSGSTGIPKGAVYRHGNFLAQVEAIREMYGIVPGEIDLPTFPLFSLFDPALGMTTVIPDMNFTKPASVKGENIAEAIADYGVTNMFGSPAVLDAVATWGVPRGAKFGTLRRVISAGAPVHPRILERFRKLLPDEARIHTPYGATESLPVASIDDATILGETRHGTDEGKGICVGRPVRSANVEIIRIDDGPIAKWNDSLRVAPGEIGEITAAGPQVTTHYFDDEKSTAAHKIDHDGAVRHRIGDVGYFDEQGRLWFCGRKSHRIHWRGKTLFTEQVEGPFNAHPGVRRSALVKGAWQGRPGDAPHEKLYLFVEPMDPAHEEWAAPQYEERLMPELQAIASRLGLELQIVLRDALPVDPRHNAKILREKLAKEVAHVQTKWGPR